MEKRLVSMLGEKDHGKSTLIGQLLILTGSTTEERVAEVRKANKGKRFEPAFILDSFSEEREQEMTIETTRADVIYKGNVFELIDVPGHLELIKNMISGASNAEMAILLVSAKPGEKFQPQTKRHIYLAKLLGVESLIVAINKMDTVKYDRSKYEAMEREVRDYLGLIGFDRRVDYIPISAYDGENLVKRSSKMPWYRGSTMIELLERTLEAEIRSHKPDGKLRILVQDSIETDRGLGHFGVVYSGSIELSKKVRVEPSGATATVSGLYLKGKPVKKAGRGSSIVFAVKGSAKVSRGDIVYDPDVEVKASNSFGCRVFLIKEFDTKSKDAVIKVNNIELHVESLVPDEVVSPVTAESLEFGRVLEPNNSVVGKIRIKERYPLESFQSFKEFGRFALYSGHEFVGLGIVE
ncbi:MAG: hypothetical protein KGH98_03765 [Candidatus Micrarchaeota archaeon]|nr:hypothetical protein [Candidatus Micrarchaeota archaeon]